MKKQSTPPNPASNLRRQAEQALRGQPVELAGLSPEEAQRLLHELRVHQIELELQNEELRRTQQELEASRAWYFDFYNLAPVGYLTLNEKGTILEANFTAAAMLGVDRGALVKKPLSRFIAREDQNSYYFHHKRLLETRSPQACEIRLVRPDSSPFWVRVETIVAQNEGGALLCRTTLSDITARKQTEEALQASETRYWELFNHMNSGVAVYEARADGADFIFMDFNQASERIEKVRKEDLIGKSIVQVFPGVKEFGLFDVFQRVWKTGEPEHHPISLYKDERLVGWRENYVYKLSSGEIVTIYDDLTERKRAEESLRESEARYRTLYKEMQQLSTQIVHVQEEERRRLSQELHDELGQALTAISINLSAIEQELPPPLSPKLSQRLAETNTLVDQTLEQVRELTLSLRPIMLDDLGLEPTLRWYVRRYTQRTNIKVKFKAINLAERPSSVLETVLYRVVQEALTNIARHAQANKVSVRLERQAATVTALIEDDGRGFDVEEVAGRANAAHGVGLLGIRERVFSLGGSFNLRSQPGQGSRLFITLPWEDETCPA